MRRTPVDQQAHRTVLENLLAAPEATIGRASPVALDHAATACLVQFIITQTMLTQVQLLACFGSPWSGFGGIGASMADEDRAPDGSNGRDRAS